MIPPGKGQSLAEAEEQAISVLDPELSEHLQLTEFAFNLIGLAQVKVPDAPVREVTQARKVCVSLMLRLSNDLRCAAFLAVRGYVLQALDLVASMYETAFTIATIGRDETLAQRWINHGDPTKTFMSSKDLTRLGLEAVGVPDLENAVRQHYLTYRQLCMAKHANPLLQAQHGYQVREHTFLAMNGPDTSDEAIRAAWFGLEHAANLAFLAVCSFTKNHVPPPEARTLLSQIQQLGESRVALHERAIARWGSDDPLPGKWRL